jgi:TonB family protein
VGAFPATVRTSLGQTFHLAKQIGQGGEGAIYEIREQADIALKLYWPTKAESRRGKISAMASAQWYKINSFVTFPIDVLFSPSGAFLGFVMRKVGASKPVHLLFSPTSRKIEFATADYRFLVRAAANLARAVASVHALSCVIGDVNHSGFLVSNKATSTLIDCDSFQVVAATKKFLCQVGTPEYTPPELQGAQFDRVERSPNHDNFGLAVLLFQILFMGRHPFSGRYQGTGDMPLEQAIGEYRFAYSPQTATTKMLPPPGAPLLTDFPPYIGQAFEMAFGRAAPRGRPTASQWVALLESLEKELVVCAADSTHHHVQGKPCPWCRMEQSYPGFVAFISAPTGVFIPTSIDITQIAAILRGIRDPGPIPNFQTVIVVPTNLTAAAPPAGLTSTLNLRAYIGGGASAVGAISIFFGGAAILPGLCILGAGILANVLVPKELKRLKQEHSRAEVKWQAAQDAWIKQSGTQQFAEAKRKTDSLIRSLSDLPNEEYQQLQILEQRKREDQLTQYLERFVIANAKIQKIGSARKAVLRSFGIETAADIDRTRISRIQGFGPTLVSSLLGWQQDLVARFVFNPKAPIDSRNLSALKARIAGRKKELEAKIRAAVTSLQQASSLSLDQRRKFAEVANQTCTAAKQAALNVQAATGTVKKASKFISICCACFAALGLIMNQNGINPFPFDYNTKAPTETSAPTPLNAPEVARQEAPSPPRAQTDEMPSGLAMPTAAASTDDTHWLESFLAANGGCGSKYSSALAPYHMQQVQSDIRAGRFDTPLFGKPILRWSDADVASALRIYHDCQTQSPRGLSALFDEWRQWIPETVALARKLDAKRKAALTVQEVARQEASSPLIETPENRRPAQAPDEHSMSTPQESASVWETSVIGHVQRYKRYPSEALARKEEGVVLLSFSLDRNGHVLARRIARSSGYADLDEEAMDMIVRADPLPAFPATMPQATLNLTVPIRFSVHR